MVRREELERPLIQFYWGYDTNDLALVADAFTADAELLATPDPDIGDTFEGEVRVIGRDALVARYAEARAGFAARGELPRHTYTNFFVDDADEHVAHVRAYYLMYVQSAAQGTVLIGLSPIYDRLRNEGGIWRIQKHHVACAHMRGYSRLDTHDAYIVTDAQPTSSAS